MAKAKKRAKKDEPWMDNYPHLAEWLNKHDARCLWQTRSDGRAMDNETPAQAYVEGWDIGGRVAILIVHANQNGWNIYTANPGNTVAETWVDAECRLGLTGEGG